ncbi:hypothetical protein H4R18_003991 [Coemansia javaensis]|uniref:Cyclin-dependent kinases regulatory subunit n=1 Tax=Coemansia javaensis TaxID=2761396 RepID=A0A9W8LFH8_9FUNG|nr:hypothetical protein H4R18_003991 [Coemansia javaensis]
MLPAFKVEKLADPAAPKLTYEQQRAADIAKYAQDISYSERYSDDECEYRHVSLPEGLRKYLPNPLRLLSEDECWGLGVRQSPGWVHYMIHKPEPHVLLFKRPKGLPPAITSSVPQPALFARNL